MSSTQMQQPEGPGAENVAGIGSAFENVHALMDHMHYVRYHS